MTKLLKSTKSMLSKLYHKAAKNIHTKSSIDLLHNKTLLYVVFFISIINLMLWMIAGDIFNVIVFALIGFLTAFFSKNMIIVLVFALVISNIIKYGIEIGQEGFQEGGDGEDPELNADGFHEGGDGEDPELNTDGFQEGGDGEDPELNTDGFQEGAKSKPKSKPKAKSSGKGAKEGMHTLDYSNFNSMANEQNILFSNISKMAPFVINVDNEAKLRATLKYEGFSTKAHRK